MKVIVSSILLATALTAQTPAISGKWHLISASDNETNVPTHRVDFVFRDGQNTLTGAVINRSTGQDIPLTSLHFNGNLLTLQMANGAPTLTMTAKGDKFEGHWMNGAMEVGPTLKLVRFQ